MKEGSPLSRFKEGISRDIQRGAHRLGFARPRVLQWLSHAGKRNVARLHSIKEVLKRYLLFYIFGGIVLLGSGLYWAWARLSMPTQHVIAPLKTQIDIYGQYIARRISSPVPDAISVAGIHAEILSIFLSALAAYVLYTHSVLSKMEEKIFQEADRINSIPVAGVYGGGQGSYIASDPKNRQALIRRFILLSMGVRGSPGRGFQDVPTEPAVRGAEILRVISALAAYYPFSVQVRHTAEGGPLLGPPKPRSFTNIKEIRQWVSYTAPH